MANARASNFCTQRHQASEMRRPHQAHSGSQAGQAAASPFSSQAAASALCCAAAAAAKASKKRRRFSRKPRQVFFESKRENFPAMVRMLTGRIPPRLPLTQWQAPSAAAAPFNPQHGTSHSSFPSPYLCTVPAFQVDEFLDLSNLELDASPSSQKRRQAPSAAAPPFNPSHSVPAFQLDQFLNFPLIELDAFSSEIRSASADLSTECPSMMVDLSVLIASSSSPIPAASADLSTECPSMMVDLSVLIASSSSPIPANALAPQTNPTFDAISAETIRIMSPAADTDNGWLPSPHSPTIIWSSININGEDDQNFAEAPNNDDLWEPFQSVICSQNGLRNW